MKTVWGGLALMGVIASITFACASEITEKHLPDDTQAIFRFRLQEILSNPTLKKMDQHHAKIDPAYTNMMDELKAKLPFDAQTIGDVTLAVSKNDRAIVFIETPECRKIVDSLREEKNFTTVTYSARPIFHILVTADVLMELESLGKPKGVGKGEVVKSAAKKADALANIKLAPEDSDNKSHPLFFTVDREKVLMISDNLAVITRQIDLLEGRARNLADNPEALVSLKPADAEALVYGSIGKGVEELAEHGVEGAYFVMSAANDTFTIKARVTLSSQEKAAQLAAMANYFRIGAPMMIDSSEDISAVDKVEFKKALQKLVITAKDGAVNFSAELPVQ